MKPQELPRTRPLTTVALILLIASAAFSVTPKEAVLYHFKGGSDGAAPTASLVEDSAHNLYGTTAARWNRKSGYCVRGLAAGHCLDRDCAL
jgi:hypothetical protein